MKFILCHGGSKLSAQIVKETNVLYGIRDDSTPYHDVYFVDYNWKKPTTEKRWNKYLAKLKALKPYMAMCPDFEYPEQWQTLKQQMIDIKKQGVKKLIITPKFHGALKLIPHWDMFIIGVSVPTGYAGFLPNLDELRYRNIHLLGGSPDQWVYLERLYNTVDAQVISADGNFALQYARSWGKYWDNTKGTYVSVRGQDTYTLAKTSILNTLTYIKNPIIIKGKRIDKVNYELQAK